MSENVNNPAEKKDGSSMVEDIMADTPEAQPKQELAPEAGAETADRPEPAAMPAPEVAPTLKAEASRKEAAFDTQKDPGLMQVERKLEDRELYEVYASLKQKQRDRFKAEGEALAVRFRGMFGRQDVDPIDVFVPIEQWLDDAPGLIRPYVRQAAKNKTDEVLALIRENAAEV